VHAFVFGHIQSQAGAECAAGPQKTEIILGDIRQAPMTAGLGFDFAQFGARVFQAVFPFGEGFFGDFVREKCF
jgi:hypothetical protein